jgi:hypothetical protein
MQFNDCFLVFTCILVILGQLCDLFLSSWMAMIAYLFFFLLLQIEGPTMKEFKRIEALVQGESILS